LITDFQDLVTPLLKKIGKEPQGMSKFIEQKLYQALSILREDVGGLNLLEDPKRLLDRYNSDGFKTALFEIERSLLSSELTDPIIANQMAEAVNGQDVLEIYEHADLENREIIERFYNYGGIP